MAVHQQLCQAFQFHYFFELIKTPMNWIYVVHFAHKKQALQCFGYAVKDHRDNSVQSRNNSQCSGCSCVFMRVHCKLLIIE